MILVVGGIKGGSGKTTIAVNLAVMRASSGKKVLLVDADEQKSSYDWYIQRDSLNSIDSSLMTIPLSGKSINSQITKLSSDYDDIIVDVGGRDTTSQRSALIVADKFLVPFNPRSIDIWTIGSVQTLISQISSVNTNLKSFSMINQADSVGSDNLDAIRMLSEIEELKVIPFMIGRRKSFPNSMSSGLSVSETKVDKKAIQEISNLYNYIF